LTAARRGGKINMSLPEFQIRSLQAEQNFHTAARNAGNIDMSLPESQIRSLQAEEILHTAARNAGKIDMSLPKSQIRSLQAEENLLTAARKAGKIDMSLPESQIQGLQAEENVLTAARRGGNINMDQSETEVRRQAMAQVRGRSVDDLAARDTAKSATTFTATEDDKHLDVMRREEFEEACKILDVYSDRSAIASIVKDKPPHKEMQRVRQQVRQCLKEVINDLDYRPTKSEQTHWHTHNPGAFSHYEKKTLKHSNQTTSVGHTHSQTKIEDHIGALHQGRAHVTMLNAGTARQCVCSTVTTYGRWPGLETRAIMMLG